MDTDRALDFLAARQPMPTDDVLGDDEIREFDAVRQHFIAHPDVRCIPLFYGHCRRGAAASASISSWTMCSEPIRMPPSSMRSMKH